MLGHPKYNYNDEVVFDISVEGKEYESHGKVYIIDSFGTFEQNEEPSYDIIASVPAEPFNGDEVLFKHIRESEVRREEK